MYQALGHLYVRDLPNGTPRRLTKQTEHFEFYPVAVARRQARSSTRRWNDEKLGHHARGRRRRGGEGRWSRRKPGHYLEPVFSPDGTQIVYRTSGGGYLRRGLWSREPGIYVVPAGGRHAGAGDRRTATQPHSARRNDRVST